MLTFDGLETQEAATRCGSSYESRCDAWLSGAPLTSLRTSHVPCVGALPLPPEDDRDDSCDSRLLGVRCLVDPNSGTQGGSLWGVQRCGGPGQPCCCLVCGRDEQIGERTFSLSLTFLPVNFSNSAADLWHSRKFNLLKRRSRFLGKMVSFPLDSKS